MTDDTVSRMTSLRGLAGTTGGALWASIIEHRAIVAFLSAMLLARFFLADWASYWNDEILSVVVYGIWNDGPIDAVIRLSENSIHPPLYQFLLTSWMTVFGDSEIATRTLSNIFVTVAAAMIYATVRLSWSKTTAFFAAATFSLMAMPMYYGLEARSYAQTLMLVSISTYLIARALFSMKKSQEWTTRGHRLSIFIVIVANTGLVLTHYYNFFWILAQAILVMIFLLLEMPRTTLLKGLLTYALIAIIPPLNFAALWGTVFIRQFRDRSGAFQVDGSVARNPLDLLITSVFEQNLIAPRLIVAAFALGIAALAVGAVVHAIRTRGVSDDSRSWSIVLATWSMVAPLVIVYITFVVAGVERYSARYFVFSIPPLAILLVLLTTVAVMLALRKASEQTVKVTAAALCVALIAVFIVPGGLESATDRKHDWRGNLQSVVRIVEGDPDTDYFLLETGFTQSSRAVYYLSRFSDDVRSDGFVTRREEESGDYSALDTRIPEPGSGGKLIIFFNHMRASHFPVLLDHLDARYELLVSNLNHVGRGYIVYGVGEAGTD